jgi:TM2 domain-containing membrane protein YozV
VTTERAPPPPNPYLILAVSLVLPGVGHVLLGQPRRGLAFLFFIVMLGWITYQLTTPQHSWLGRYAGGVFIYGFAVLDAYRWARLRAELALKP